MNFAQRYKECNPLETITKFRTIINDLGVEVEEIWINSVDNIYSVSISLNNTSINTNGKGSTKEFALASAYGEMLERLQNMAHFRMKRRFDKFPFNFDCIISPDEILTKNFGTNENQIKWFKEALKKNEESFLEKFKLLWENVYTKNYEGKIVNLDYNSIDSDEYITIPLTMVDYYYGTNGMASGNTMYEALVQGISEIIERATLSMIIKEQLTPPDITDYVKENFKYLNRLINNIEKENEHFKVLVKDGSLGRDVPVIIVILLDTINKEYMVSFGCHLCIDVAIERTLTELMQGQDINNFYGMTSINKEIDNSLIQRNIDSIFSDGRGVYPKSLFKSQPSYQSIIRNKKNNFDSNEEIYRFLIQFIKNMNYNIYVRDESFLGVPTYHIIVPGLSEVVEVSYTKDIKNIFEYKEMICNIEKISKITNSELKKLLEFLEELEFEECCSMQTILDIPVKNSSALQYIDINILMAIGYIKLANYNKAYNYIEIYIKHLKRNDASNEMVNYYQTMLSIINLKSLGFSDNNIINILQNFSSTQSVLDCLNDISTNKNLFKEIPCITCNKCKDCEINNDCYMSNEYKIYKSLISKKKNYLMMV